MSSADPTGQGYKAGALQIALQNTDAEFIAIFDADYTPRSDFLLRTIPYLLQDDQLAIVQSRWTHLNRYFNRVTSAVAIGIDVHFMVEQTGRYASKCFQNFNGSGGVLRRSALVEAGGWQADTLAEDLDASYRMQMKGYHILFLKDLTSPGEVPPTVPSFKKQQARWANGSLRTARKLLPSILPNPKIKLYQRLEAFIHLTGYMLHPMMFVSFLLASFGTIFEVDTFLVHSHMLTPSGRCFRRIRPEHRQGAAQPDLGSAGCHDPAQHGGSLALTHRQLEAAEDLNPEKPAGSAGVVPARERHQREQYGGSGQGFVYQPPMGIQANT